MTTPVARTEPPIVDAHVHLWDPRVLHYPWLAGLPALERPFLVDDYRAATADAPIARLLVVEGNCLPAESALETAFVARLAEAEPRIAGIVAFVDVAARGAAALDGLAPMTKGVRQNVQGHGAGFCLTPSFVEGAREAGRRGLPFDLCATHDQLDDVLALVERCPGTRFVLDHCGKPPIRDGDARRWSAHVAAIAGQANAWCKLSGLLTEAGARPTFDDLAPYAEHAVQCFGTERLLYGSDWPVLTLAGTYGGWLDVTRRLLADCDEAAQRAFYHDNAVRVYGL